MDGCDGGIFRYFLKARAIPCLCTDLSQRLQDRVGLPTMAYAKALSDRISANLLTLHYFIALITCLQSYLPPICQVKSLIGSSLIIVVYRHYHRGIELFIELPTFRTDL
jgi:hypothetical protein